MIILITTHNRTILHSGYKNFHLRQTVVIATTKRRTSFTGPALFIERFQLYGTVILDQQWNAHDNVHDKFPGEFR